MKSIEKYSKELKELENRVSKMQEHIIKSEKMVSLGSLVAGAAHEISTPIGLGVTGMSHFLSQTQHLKELFDSQEMTQDDFENYLKDAQKTADIVYTNLINAKNFIQSFKRVSIDQSNEFRQEFKLYEYINEIIVSLHNKIKRTKIEVLNQIDSNILLLSYPGSFAQIFTNLIMNSLLHAFKDGERGTITISAKENGENIELYYHDNGAGISSENIGKIYEPFFTTAEDRGGSGLGMQIIYDLVTKQLNGKIEVESTIGNGVLFTITIPREAS